MAKEVSRYEQKGVKFHQFTAAWYMAHPEAMEGLKKALPILINR